MVARQFYQHFPLTASNSVTFPKQSGDAAAVLNEVAEGAEAILDVTPYTQINVVPKKIFQGFIITRETIEDALTPTQQDQLVRIALRAANKIDKDCISTIDAGFQANNNFNSTGKSVSFAPTGGDGTFTLSGSGGPAIGNVDLTKAIALVEQYNYVPDTLLVHPNAKKFLTQLPHFSTLPQYGLPVNMEGLLQIPGKFGDILGMDAFASTNTTNTSTVTSAYVLSRGRTTNILGQNSRLYM